MAGFTERLAFLISAQGGQAIREFQKVSGAAKRELGAVDKQLSTFGNLKMNARGLGAGLGAGLLFGGGIDIAAQAVEVAQQVEVMRTKTATVFGQQIEDVRRWADANNEAFGLTKDNLAGLAANFGDLLIPMGFTRQEAAKMSTDVVGLAGALQAWSGGTRTTAEVSSILAKAMLGERESLKELGISILDADVKARLAAKGQQALTGSLLEQAKAVATQELIFEKSADAQKAWADGSMDAVKRQNELKAAIAQSKLEIGEGLLPLVQDLTPALTAGAKAMREFIAPFAGAADLVRDTNQALEDLFMVDEIKGLLGLTNEVTAAEENMARAVEHGSIARADFNDKVRISERDLQNATEATRHATKEMIELARSTELYGDALDGTLGAHLDLEDASDNLADAEKRVRDALDGTGDSAGGATEKIRTYQDALSDIFDAAVDVDEAHEQAKDAVESLRDALGQSTGSESAGDFRDRFFGKGDPRAAARSVVSATAAAVRAARSEVDAMVESGEVADTAEARKAALRERLVDLKEQFPQVAGQIDRYVSALDRVPNLTTDAETSTRNLSKAKQNLEQDTRDLIRAAEDEVDAMVESGRIADTARDRHKALLYVISDLKNRFPELAGVIDTYVQDVNRAWQTYLNANPGIRRDEAVASARGPGNPQPGDAPINITQNISGDGLSSKEVADLAAERVRRALVGSRAA